MDPSDFARVKFNAENSRGARIALGAERAQRQARDATESQQLSDAGGSVGIKQSQADYQRLALSSPESVALLKSMKESLEAIKDSSMLGKIGHAMLGSTTQDRIQSQEAQIQNFRSGLKSSE